jgi:tetratricopeptide (TPR) repeat protein
MAEARKVQKEHPDRALGFAIEAEVLVTQKKWTEAAAAYREAIVRQPFPVLAIARYSALQNAGKSAEATDVAEKWIKENPKDVTFHSYLGDQSQLKKDFRAAVLHYQAALKNEPDNPRLLNNLAFALIELGDPKASDIAERAYVQAPFNADVIDTFACPAASRTVAWSSCVTLVVCTMPVSHAPGRRAYGARRVRASSAGSTADRISSWTSGRRAARALRTSTSRDA